MKQAPRRRKRPIPTWTPLANLRPNRLQERGAQSPQSRKALETAHSCNAANGGELKGRRALKAERHWRLRFWRRVRVMLRRGRRALKAERHWRPEKLHLPFRYGLGGAEPSKPKGTGDTWQASLNVTGTGTGAQSPQSRKALETGILRSAFFTVPLLKGAEPSKPKGTGD